MSKLNKLFYVVLLTVFLLSIFKLNYNTPFNDEAIYIVIGRLGLFAHDWWTYGASYWMAGSPYFYPTLTALAYQIGGIVGSRLLNVIFGIMAVEEVYRLTRQLRLFDPDTNQLAGIFAAAITGVSAVGLYVARLATYDMPSFLLLIFAINSFLKAGNYNNGKYYFLSSVALFFAFLTKIIAAIFLPLLFIISLLIIRSRSTEHRQLYIKYFLPPLVLGFGIYAIFFARNLFTFTSTHIDEGTSGTYRDVLTVIWENTNYILALATLTLPVMIFTKKHRTLIFLLLLAATVPIFHLVLNRVPTLDKHLYLTIVFLSIIIGYGLSWLSRIGFPSRITAALSALAVLALFFISRPTLTNLEQSWLNTANISRELNKIVTPKSRVLTENGASLILSLYDKVYPPTHMYTFDWIDYSDLEGQPAYVQAVKDKYFDYIELDGQHEASDLLSDISYQLTARYQLIFNQGDFKLYARIQ